MDTAYAVVGIDVSKKKLDVALLVNGKMKAKVVENTADGHKSLLEWLLDRHGSSHIATGGSS